MSDQSLDSSVFVDRKDALYFIRLTWVAAKLQVGGSMPTESDAAAPSTQANKTLRLLLNIAILSTRYSKVVAMLSGAREVSMLEEKRPHWQEKELIVTKNPSSR